MVILDGIEVLALVGESGLGGPCGSQLGRAELPDLAVNEKVVIR